MIKRSGMNRVGVMVAAAGLAMGASPAYGQDSAEVQDAIERAGESHGAFGERSNAYLTANCEAWETHSTLQSNAQASITPPTTQQTAAAATNPAGTFIDFHAAGENSSNFVRPERTVRNPGNMGLTMFGEVEGTTERYGDEGVNTSNVRRVSFSDVGADFDPDVTRDGSKVVFASTQHRVKADLYIKDAYSRTVTRLTDHPAQDVMPAVSPDGDYVAFCSDREGTWDLFVMPTSGGNPVRLTSETTHDLHPTWSPDGTRLAFSRFGEVSGRWEIWVMDVASPAGLQFIGYGLFPDWCPVSGTGQDGTDRIAFQRSRERGDRSFSLWTVDYSFRTGSAGRETEVVSSPERALINPSWSPDGEFLLYAAVEREGQSGSSLWMIGADGRGAVQFVGGSTTDLMPTWGSNDHVFFVSDRSGAENIWAIEVGQSVRTANVQRMGALESPYATVETDTPGVGDDR